jgi:hypothetical protein
MRSRSQKLALAAIVAACAATAGTACTRPLDHAQPSPDALAEAVLSALEARDVERLRALAVSEAEFRDVIWPELPASRPERNLSMDFVWKDLQIKSEAGLRRVLAEHGGRSQHLVRVGFNGDTSQYRSYLVHREAVVTARDPARGEERLALFGSMLEQDGRFKVFSYVVD